MSDRSLPHDCDVFELLNDDPRFGLRRGDVLECVPYWLDPFDKLTVIRRVADGFDPNCNVYRSQVRRVSR